MDHIFWGIISNTQVFLLMIWMPTEYDPKRIHMWIAQARRGFPWALFMALTPEWVDWIHFLEPHLLAWTALSPVDHRHLMNFYRREPHTFHNPIWQRIIQVKTLLGLACFSQRIKPQTGDKRQENTQTADYLTGNSPGLVCDLSLAVWQHVVSAANDPWAGCAGAVSSKSQL